VRFFFHFLFPLSRADTSLIDGFLLCAHVRACSYGAKIEAWCLSVGLKLDAVVRPGNEDAKTMDNCLAMIDGLKTLDPLRRSEPVSDSRL
jgi:hypothetical protein